MREIINLNTKWAFSKEASQVPQEMPANWYWVNLPHTWNAIDGQDGNNDYYRGTCYYAKTISKQDLPDAEQYYLEINGANSSADVYVNGKHLAHHDGGYSTWRVNITEQLNTPLTNDTFIVIAVDNAANDRVYPQMADFTFYGGLYRDVNLIAVSNVHFDLDYYGGSGLKVTPRKQANVWEVEVQAYLAGISREKIKNVSFSSANAGNGENRNSPTSEKITQKYYQVKFTLLDQDSRIVAEKILDANDASTVQHRFELKDAHLWNGKKDPYLYTARAEIMEGTSEPSKTTEAASMITSEVTLAALDMVSARFGCRTYEIDPEKGFLLNGVSYPLRGVSRHQDRWGIGNALLPEHHEEDIDLILEMGANTIRLAHYQHAQYFYDLCDEKGLVIWAEIPYISQHMPKGRENTFSQMRELIIQNYNHPSICVWGLSNEITMHGDSDPDLLENHQLLNQLVKELDPTRKTTLAALSMCPIEADYLRIPDCISYNHYFGWYGGDTSMNGPWFDHFHETYPNIPVGVSEYGCEGLNWHTSDPQQGDYTEEYQAYYHEELIKQLYTRPYIWATHVWNMFDFAADARNEGGENGQNHKGLVTFDRKYKKDAFYAYKAWLSDEPFVHICGKRYVDRVEERTKVTVYSNLPQVELFANGVSLGVKEAPDHFFYFEVPNVGETKLKAVAMGKCSDESFLRKVDTFNENYRLNEKGAILNWFDITAPEGYFSLNDKMGDILKSGEGEKLLQDLLKGLSGGEAGGFTIEASMMQMLEGFTVLRLTSLMGTAGMKFTKEQLLELNEKLNKIPK